MSMKNLFKSIGNWFNGTTDDAAEAMKDPLRDHKLAIKAGESKLEDFRNRIAQLMASNTALKRKLTYKKEESEKYDNIAKLAAKSGKVEDVTEAVTIKQGVDREVEDLSHQIELTEQQIKGLRSTLDEGEKKVEKAKNDLTSLAARHEGAKIRNEMAKAESEFVGSGGVSSLEDLRKLVEQEEDTAVAQEELSGGSAVTIEKRLEEKYLTAKDADAEVQKYLDEAKKGKSK